ncbi:MAG: hypothetical protein DME01_22045 [Candidatus Rokuibacteriota bacterium]|nr:MAG: hypothetical protein DME01_22045 [Candidatus Rokubacteria bacterium]
MPTARLPGDLLSPMAPHRDRSRSGSLIRSAGEAGARTETAVGSLGRSAYRSSQAATRRPP